MPVFAQIVGVAAIILYAIILSFVIENIFDGVINLRLNADQEFERTRFFPYLSRS